MATSQDVIAFKSHVSDFKDVLDADVAAALDEADIWLDPKVWSDRDFPLARRLLAAHLLQMAMFYATAGVGGTTSKAAGLYVRMIGFGERRVMYGERKITATRAGVSAPGEDELEETIYGLRFLRLRYRNIPGVLTV